MGAKAKVLHLYFCLVYHNNDMKPFDFPFLTSLVEFPCGRTALTAAAHVSRRSLLGDGNANQHSRTSLTGLATISPRSTAAGTTATNNSVKPNPRKKLPLWVDSEADDPTEEGPTEETPHPNKRIVGGTVVVPGEIPWQVYNTDVVPLKGMHVVHNSFLPVLFR